MRLGRIISAIPILAVGLALWRHAQWVAGPENSQQDGTCRGIEEDISYLLSIAFYLLSVLVLLKGIPFRQLIRFFEGEDEGPSDRGLGKDRRWEEPRATPLHPHENTTEFFS
jgi:hypothetical protein